MEVRLIACSCLSISEDPGRTEKKEKHNSPAMRAMAQSIEVLGLLQPIGVVPDKAKDGEFKVIYGRRRFRCVSELMKSEEIRCLVFEDFDDATQENAALQENVHQLPLSKDEQFAATQRILAYYMEYFPHLVSGKSGVKTAPGKKATDKSNEARSRAAKGLPDEPEAEDEETTAQEPVTVLEAVQAATGTGERNAQYQLAAARAFTPDQIAALSGKATVVERSKIASIEDKAIRDEVVSLVASGYPVAEAIDSVAHPESENAPPDPEKMSDDQWFDHECDDLYNRLPGEAQKDAYKRAAIFYRRTGLLRKTIRREIASPAADASPKGMPILRIVSALQMIVGTDHPKHWLLCGSCNGAGHVSTVPPTPCRTCRIEGFVMTKVGVV